jgi:hypothetical protein
MKWNQISLRRLLISIALFCISFQLAITLGSLYAGESTAFLAATLVIGKFVFGCSAIGNLFRHPLTGAIVGLFISAPLAPLTWMLYRAADC